MARTINLAVEVSWRINPCTPVLATARAAVWVPSISAPDSIIVGVTVPEHGLQLARGLTGVPPELARKIFTSGTSFTGHDNHALKGKALSQVDVDILNFEFPVLVCKQNAHPSRCIKGDPLIARNAFLGLPQEIPALSDFLATYGTWSVDSTQNITFDNPQPTSIQSNVSVVEPQQFWRQQRSLRHAMREGASLWISRNQPEFQLSSRKKFPHFFHEDSTCLEAIVNSFTVDFMRGARVMRCRRADCQQIFEVSHKGKMFCSQYCGHITSVRRSREPTKRSRAGKKERNGPV